MYINHDSAHTYQSILIIDTSGVGVFFYDVNTNMYLSFMYFHHLITIGFL